MLQPNLIVIIQNMYGFVTFKRHILADWILAKLAIKIHKIAGGGGLNCK
jgi:hypothetical protein